MNEPIQRRPKPGDTVKVGDLPEVFRVLDFDGATYVLESVQGVRCKAGVLAVMLVESQEVRVA